MGYCGSPYQVGSFSAGKTTHTAKQYAQLYMDRILSLYGDPKTIISDQGTQFIARFWEHFHAALGTQLIRSSAYHP